VAELYRVVSSHERITTAGGSIVAIQLHEAPTDEAAFIDDWNARREGMARNPGYLASTLHRALKPDNHIRFVELTRFTTTDAAQRRRTRPTR
jgi:heme-degrading monooxygenase HmoA